MSWLAAAYAAVNRSNIALGPCLPHFQGMAYVCSLIVGFTGIHTLVQARLLLCSQLHKARQLCYLAPAVMIWRSTSSACLRYSKDSLFTNDAP